MCWYQHGFIGKLVRNHDLAAAGWWPWQPLEDLQTNDFTSVVMNLSLFFNIEDRIDGTSSTPTSLSNISCIGDWWILHASVLEVCLRKVWLTSQTNVQIKSKHVWTLGRPQPFCEAFPNHNNNTFYLWSTQRRFTEGIAFKRFLLKFLYIFTLFNVT